MICESENPWKWRPEYKNPKTKTLPFFFKDFASFSKQIFSSLYNVPTRDKVRILNKDKWFYLNREIATVVEYYALLCTNSIVFSCLRLAILHCLLVSVLLFN